MATPLNTDVLIIGAGTRLMELTVDPTAGGGVSAPFGAVALRSTGSDTQLWRKSGAGNTQWTQVGSVDGLQLLSEKDAAGGYAGLDGGGLLDPGALPATVAVKNVAQTFTASQVVAIVDVAFSGTMTPAAAGGNCFRMTITGDATLNVPSGMVAGGAYSFVLINDGVGSHDITWGAGFGFEDDVEPDFSAVPINKRLYVSGLYDGTILGCGFIKNLPAS